MDKIKLPKLDHTVETLEESLGLTQYDVHYVRTAVLYECVASPLLVDMLFDSAEEAPEDLKTSTGILERTMSHLRNGQEQIYGLMIFNEGYGKLRELVHEQAEIIREGLAAGKSNDEILVEIMAKDGKLEMPLGEIIQKIKKNDFNFQSFVEELLPAECYDASGKFILSEAPEVSPEDIGDMLKEMLLRALKNRDKKKGEDKDEDGV